MRQRDWAKSRTHHYIVLEEVDWGCTSRDVQRVVQESLLEKEGVVDDEFLCHNLLHGREIGHVEPEENGNFRLDDLEEERVHESTGSFKRDVGMMKTVGASADAARVLDLVLRLGRRWPSDLHLDSPILQHIAANATAHVVAVVVGSLAELESKKKA